MKSDDRISNGYNRTETDKQITAAPVTSRNTSDSEKRRLAQSARRKQNRRIVLKYLSVAVLFAVTVVTIAGICLIAAQQSAKPSNTVIYSDYQANQNRAATQNSSGNNNVSLSPIESIADDIGEDRSYEIKAEDITAPEETAEPEDDTDTEPIQQHGELKKTAAPKVTVPAAETTAEPVDLYVSRIDTDIFFETTAAPEIKSEPETTETEPETTAPETIPEVPEPEPEAIYNVTLKYIQGDSIKCTTASTTVGELLTAMNIKLSEKEKQYIDVNQVISSDCVIQMEVSETKTVSVEEGIPYNTVCNDSQTVPKGTESVITAGVTGVKVKEYVNQYINGSLISETFSKEYIKQYPVNAVVEKGVGGTITASDGTVYSYTHYIDMKATTYTGGGTTASGLPADESVIAVDPNVIPLNTKVYVKGDYGDFGIRIAADIGGGIKNNIIDVYLNSDNPLFADFGWRNVKVYFIEQ